VRVGVRVWVAVPVTKVPVRVGVLVRVRVLVRVKVRVGVRVGEGVIVFERVIVMEGVIEGDKVGRIIAVTVGLGVTPNWANKVETASPGLTGVISCWVQK
jgi:hypothetical protein